VHTERHRIPDIIHTDIKLRGEPVAQDSGVDRPAGIPETVLAAATNHRAGIRGHNVLHGDVPVYGAGPGEGEHSVEIILHSAYHREMRHGGTKKAGRIG
jgi:hypothetical protein